MVVSAISVLPVELGCGGGGGWWSVGRQPDLPMALRRIALPGDRMMDWVTPPPAEGAAAQSH